MNKPITLTFLLSGSLSLMANEKPNIIMIYIDDMAYADLSCYGGDLVETSNIDQLADQGIRFTQYYSVAPISSPSRVGLTTGMYPTRWGIRTYLQARAGNKKNQQNDFLENRAPSMARLLKGNGYSTAHFGKWHMGGGRDVYNAPSITSYGFDEYSSTWESPDPDKALTASDWIWSESDSIKRWNRTAYFVDKTLDFIKRNKNVPCFINMWPDDVHSPFVPDPEEVPTTENDWESPKPFKAVLKELDVQIGRLTDGLRKIGEEENTIIIFTSDNGPHPDFGNERTGELRGKKGTLYEGGINMPLIIRWPQKIAPGQVDETTILTAVDFLPTLCKITKTKVDVGYPIDGEDMSKAVLGKKELKRKKPVYWEFYRARPKNENRNQNVSPQLAIREGDWKFLVNPDGTSPELYNIKENPSETENLIDKYPNRVALLKNKALRWYNRSFREFVD